MHHSSPRTLQEWLAWQECLHPVKIDLGLERLRPVAERLGLVKLRMPVITVAGTNGKGSSVVFLESMLSAHGLGNGSYSSPWLRTYNECVRINAQAVSDERLIESFERVERVRSDVSLTCFEYRTLAAVDLIARSGIDVAILEVGLGGRLDAVNLFAADVSLITTLGLDHQQWLGPDLESIAREKAGVMRKDQASICADAAMVALLEPHAAVVGAVLYGAGRDYSYSQHGQSWNYRGSHYSFEQLPLPSPAGSHQLANAAGAITALAKMDLQQSLSRDRIIQALVQVQLPGRLEYHRGQPGDPDVLLDVAHNPQACAVLAQWLTAHSPSGRILAVCGMYQDKDPANCLAKLVPLVSEWHLGSLAPPRGGEAQLLERVLAGHCRSRHCYATIGKAFKSACSAASDGDLVVVFGSFESVRQVLELLDIAS